MSVRAVRSFRVSLCLFSLLVLGACAAAGHDVSDTASTSPSALAPDAPTLDTFTPDSIEIDQLSGGPGDANNFVGNDPADGTASAQLPAGGSGDFIDWDDLGGDLGNHRLLDLNGSDNRDPSSFPRSNECVAGSRVLSKMDLTYVGGASNSNYAYLAVQRSDNNGDAGYSWVFTKTAPGLVAGQAPCKATESRLVYDIQVGDILLVGHFQPSSGPLLRFFRAKVNRNAVSAVLAIDYTDATLWQENASMVLATAVNTTKTSAGAFGSAGVNAVTGGVLGTELFAETAIDAQAFTGGNTCGASFFGTVISRSSGAGGTSPDLKDLAGPAKFNFGVTTATVTLTPTCGLDIEYAASASGGLADDFECTWEFDGDPSKTATGCEGTIGTLSAGSHSAEVTVTNTQTGCSDVVTTNQVTSHPALTLDVDLTAHCDRTFDYAVTPNGGSGSFAYAWSFTGGACTPSSSTTASGSVTATDTNVDFTGAVTVTDLRTDVSGCTAQGSDTARPLAPLAVDLDLRAAPATCPSLETDEVIYDAAASGGTGDYLYEWSDATCTGDSCAVGAPDALCADKSLFVKVKDPSGVCAIATSETETYDKVTVITASDAP